MTTVMVTVMVMMMVMVMAMAMMTMMIMMMMMMKEGEMKNQCRWAAISQASRFIITRRRSMLSNEMTRPDRARSAKISIFRKEHAFPASDFVISLAWCYCDFNENEQKLLDFDQQRCW
ncbi:hypothetical protein T01_1323 [Trichinella spiralis]|uniref:Uncharacterized protein n=1 Tax=Trichinella spiralis TaxID=6334 RepID=A0A0V1AUG1_TRISP|nr:hypothetical protein T01_1323 [Trichinella spiralis]